MEIDTYLEKHLDKYIEWNVSADDADAFRNYALALCTDIENPLDANWSSMYGKFISACNEERKMREGK